MITILRICSTCVCLLLSLTLIGCTKIENFKLYTNKDNQTVSKETESMSLGSKSDTQALPSTEDVLKTEGNTPRTPLSEVSEDQTPNTLKNDDIIDKTPVTPEKVLSKKTTFKIGDKGDVIKEIQISLNKFGYTLPVDGDFGQLTFDAVLNFQYRLGLDTDGIVGPETLSRLNEEPTSQTKYQPDMIFAAMDYSNKSELENHINDKGYSSSTNFYICVDLKNQKVNVFQGGQGNWKLIRSMNCASGASSTPTPKGFFRIEQKGPFFWVDSNIKCDYYTGFYGNYLFHTVLLDKKGNIVDGTLGTPISHGCIRLSIEDAKFIYFNIPIETAVWIN